MTNANLFSRTAWLLGIASLVIGFYAGAAAGQDKSVARCVAAEGALLARGGDGKWQTLTAGSAMPADRSLIALFSADFKSNNGAVAARVLADVGQRGPFPVLEAGVRFHKPAGKDLDISLERGILGLANKKNAGAAHVRVRLHGHPIDITLSEPGATVGIELYGRHLPGAVNVSDAKKDVPVASVAFFALKGEVVLTSKKHAARLHAPPGQALLIWDSVTREPEIFRLEKLPDSVKPLDEKERKALHTICGFAKNWAANPAAIMKATQSADAQERKAAVVALGALDQLPGLLKVLSNEQFADTRDMAILVTRHWLGREPGQTVRFYKHLTEKEKLTPTQAKNFLNLINGFDADKMRQPETFQLLIDALNHQKVVVRELARWHLVRMAPAGQKIAFDAAGPEADRHAAIKAWRELIPPGQLPPAPKKLEK